MSKGSIVPWDGLKVLQMDKFIVITLNVALQYENANEIIDLDLNIS